MRKRVIEVLDRSSRFLTAREIATELYKDKLIPYPVRQAVAPRLTELESDGIVEAVGKVYDEATKRNVAVYKLVKPCKA
jgi:repressor of nif and glnA expression